MSDKEEMKPGVALGILLMGAGVATAMIAGCVKIWTDPGLGFAGRLALTGLVVAVVGVVTFVVSDIHEEVNDVE